MRRASIQRSSALFALACGLLIWSPSAAWSASGKLGEYEIKAVLLSHFATFVGWPPQSFSKTDGNFALCVLGRDPFGQHLERTFEGKTVGGREVSIHRSKSLRNLDSCQLLFVSSSEEKRIGAVIRALAGQNVLTVSDIQQFVDRGGMIQLNRSGSRVQFEINRSAAEQVRLKISPQLLKLATNVRSARHGR